LYGFFKVKDISDWTQERPFKVEFNYSVQVPQKAIEYLARIKDVTDILCSETSQAVICDDFI